VPQKDMPAAADAMRKVGISGTVKNLGQLYQNASRETFWYD
jgi:hypothetical protein